MGTSSQVYGRLLHGSSVTHMPRKYSKGSQKEVQKAMHKFKRGTLKSGASRKPVRNPKQAIAIGLSEARKKGKRVPRTRG